MGCCFFSVGAGGGSHPHPRIKSGAGSALSLKGEGEKGAPVDRVHSGVGAVGCRLPGGPLTEFGGYAESASPLGEGEERAAAVTLVAAVAAGLRGWRWRGAWGRSELRVVRIERRRGRKTE